MAKKKHVKVRMSHKYYVELDTIEVPSVVNRIAMETFDAVIRYTGSVDQAVTALYITGLQHGFEITKNIIRKNKNGKQSKSI